MSEFEYTGYLIFSPATYSTKQDFTSASEWRDILRRELPEFQPGTPRNPGAGYQLINNSEIISPVFANRSSSSLEDIIYSRYTAEVYEEKEAYVEGEIREVNVRTVDSVDVFWIPPNNVLFRGKKRSIDRVKADLQREVFEDLFINSVKFDPIFFENIFERDIASNQLNVNDVHKIVSDGVSETTSSVSFTGNVADVGMDAGIPKKIEANFEFRGRRILAEISSDRIHIRVSGSLEDMGAGDRMMESVLFCRELLDLV